MEIGCSLRICRQEHNFRVEDCKVALQGCGDMYHPRISRPSETRESKQKKGTKEGSRNFLFNLTT